MANFKIEVIKIYKVVDKFDQVYLITTDPEKAKKKLKKVIKDMAKIMNNGK